MELNGDNEYKMLNTMPVTQQRLLFLVYHDSSLLLLTLFSLLLILDTAIMHTPDFLTLPFKKFNIPPVPKNNILYSLP